METVVLVIHLMVAFALVVVVLLQRSEGGALGMGAGTGGGLTTARGAANMLTRATAILATCFIITSLTLAVLAGNGKSSGSILDKASVTAEQTTDNAADEAADKADTEKTESKDVSNESSTENAPEVPLNP